MMLSQPPAPIVRNVPLLSSAEQGYRMHMATRVRRWTRTDLTRLPDDGNRYEVLDGELFVTPQAAKRHQRIAVKLVLALEPWCIQHGVGYLVGPGSVPFGKNELQPDVQVIPGLEPRGEVAWTDCPLPILVCEILSDSTAHRDLGKKRDAYLRIGIPTYWVVDPDQRRVLVWTTGAREAMVVTDVLRWQPRPDVPPLEIPLASILPLQ